MQPFWVTACGSFSIRERRGFKAEIEELSRRVEEISELEVNLHETLQETEQLEVQLNELRAKQREGAWNATSFKKKYEKRGY